MAVYLGVDLDEAKTAGLADERNPAGITPTIPLCVLQSKARYCPSPQPSCYPSPKPSYYSGYPDRPGYSDSPSYPNSP